MKSTTTEESDNLWVEENVQFYMRTTADNRFCTTQKYAMKSLLTIGKMRQVSDNTMNPHRKAVFRLLETQQILSHHGGLVWC